MAVAGEVHSFVSSGLFRLQIRVYTSHVRCVWVSVLRVWVGAVLKSVTGASRYLLSHLLKKIQAKPIFSQHLFLFM